MDTIIALLNNQWIIGILVWLITALITGLTKYVVGRISKYNEIKKANKEIIVLLKRMVPENFKIDTNIVNSLINSVAKKYNINKSQLFKVEDICDELIWEIIETDYISAENKNIYCNDLYQSLKYKDDLCVSIALNELKPDKFYDNTFITILVILFLALSSFLILFIYKVVSLSVVDIKLSTVFNVASAVVAGIAFTTALINYKSKVKNK